MTYSMSVGFNPATELVRIRAAVADHIPRSTGPAIDPWPAADLPESLESDRRLLWLTSPSGFYATVGAVR